MVQLPTISATPQLKPLSCATKKTLSLLLRTCNTIKPAYPTASVDWDGELFGRVCDGQKVTEASHVVYAR